MPRFRTSVFYKKKSTTNPKQKQIMKKVHNRIIWLKKIWMVWKILVVGVDV